MKKTSNNNSVQAHSTKCAILPFSLISKFRRWLYYICGWCVCVVVSRFCFWLSTTLDETILYISFFLCIDLCMFARIPFHSQPRRIACNVFKVSATPPPLTLMAHDHNLNYKTIFVLFLFSFRKFRMGASAAKSEYILCDRRNVDLCTNCVSVSVCPVSCCLFLWLNVIQAKWYTLRHCQTVIRTLNWHLNSELISNQDDGKSNAH